MNGSLHIKTCLLMNESESITMIRDRVFAEEQGIDPTLDWDGKDAQAVHLLAYLNHSAVGVARLREVSADPRLKLERLAILKPFRRQGIGSELVYTAIAYAQSQGYQQMVLNAQMQTLNFYQGLGFESVGEPFYEAGIPHIKMQQSLETLPGLTTQN